MTAPDSQGSTPSLVLAALLVLACSVLGAWLLWSSEVSPVNPARSASTADEPTPLLTGQVRGLEVAARPERLSVTFSTDRDAECRLEFGYTPQDLRFRSSREGWSSRQHLLAVEGLKPGAGWFRVRGRLKDGSSFCEPAAEVVIPEPLPEVVLAAASADSRATGGTTTAGTPGRHTAAARPPGQEEESTTSLAVRRTATAAVAAPTGIARPTVAVEGPYAQLPPADPNSAFGKRARDASSGRVAFGPTSLAPDVRGRLEAQIRELYRAWDKRGDLNVARELARAYVEFRDLRKAFYFSDLLLATRPKDEECLRIHLDYFRNYGMGWKVQETWARLLEVRPDDPDLRAQAARDRVVFGQHRTLGPADKGDLQ